MKRYWILLLCAALASCVAIDANGQASVARDPCGGGQGCDVAQDSEPEALAGLRRFIQASMHSAEVRCAGLRPLAPENLMRKRNWFRRRATSGTCRQRRCSITSTTSARRPNPPGRSPRPPALFCSIRTSLGSPRICWMN